MKIKFFLPGLITTRMSLSTWDRFQIPGEKIRSFLMTPKKTLLIGTNKGNLHTYDLSTRVKSTIKIDNFPVYDIDSSLYLTRTQTASNIEILWDHHLKKIKTFHWTNITVAQGLTPYGIYARLSGNDWLFLYDKHADTSVSRYLPIGSFVVDSACVRDCIVYITLDWSVGVYNMTSDTFQKTKIPTTKGRPTFLKTRLKSETNPIYIRLLVGGTKETSVFDLCQKKDQLSVQTYRTLSFPSKKGVFLSQDAYAFVSPENKICSLTPEHLFQEEKKETSFTTHFQFVSPFLMYNDDDSVWVKRLD